MKNATDYRWTVYVPLLYAIGTVYAYIMSRDRLPVSSPPRGSHVDSVFTHFHHHDVLLFVGPAEFIRTTTNEKKQDRNANATTSAEVTRTSGSGRGGQAPLRKCCHRREGVYV